MFIENDGIRLHVELSMPGAAAGGETCPLVILIHGFTGNMDEPHLTAMADMMNGAGFAVLRAEMYGHGQSGGSFRDHTLFKWLTDMTALVDYAGQLPFVSELYLCGHSQGGLTVMLAGSMERDRVSGIIALSPAVCIPDDARRGCMLGQPFDPDSIPDIIGVYADGPLGGNYARAAQMIHLEDVSRYEGPVLIVHGDDDETVDVQWAYRSAELFRNCTLEIIPGDTHCYDRHPDRAVEAVRKWLAGRR